MWYFILKQTDLKPAPYRALQQLAALTEVEPFNEPFGNLCVFSVADYPAFVDALDGEGLAYEALSQRPFRQQLLARLRESVGGP